MTLWLSDAEVRDATRKPGKTRPPVYPRPTREQVLALLDYDPQTGIFTWNVRRRGKGKLGHQAGTFNENGYRLIPIGGKRRRFRAHQLAWLVFYGEWPSDSINHKNGNKDDNRIVNLELMTLSENTAHAHRTGLTNNVGESNGRAKLTLANVREILTSQTSAADLAARYGVRRDAVTNVRAGRSWKSVPRDGLGTTQ